MATEASITIEGIDEITRKLIEVGKITVLSRAVKAGALHMKGAIARYPPSTDANRPRQYNSFFSIKSRKANNTWYQRGYGPRWVRKDGSIGGRTSSEELGQSWTVEFRDGGLTGVVGNDASYGPYVQGEQQARFHRARNWKTTEDVSKEETAIITKFIKDEIDRALAR